MAGTDRGNPNMKSWLAINMTLAESIDPQQITMTILSAIKRTTARYRPSRMKIIIVTGAVIPTALQDSIVILVDNPSNLNANASQKQVATSRRSQVIWSARFAGRERSNNLVMKSYATVLCCLACKVAPDVVNVACA